MSEAATLAQRRLPGGFMLKLVGKLAGEVGPLLIFFLTYDWWGIFVATGAYAVAAALSLGLTWLLLKRLPILPLVSTALVGVFAGLTIALNNELFIMLKPTVVNGFYAVLIGLGWCLGFRIVRLVLAPAVTLDDAGERVLTWRITGYLAALAVANEVVWRSFPLDTWVYFKVFVSIGFNMLFFMLNFPFIKRHRVASAEHCPPPDVVLAARTEEKAHAEAGRIGDRLLRRSGYLGAGGRCGPAVHEGPRPGPDRNPVQRHRRRT